MPGNSWTRTERQAMPRGWTGRRSTCQRTRSPTRRYGGMAVASVPPSHGPVRLLIRSPMCCEAGEEGVVWGVFLSGIPVVSHGQGGSASFQAGRVCVCVCEVLTLGVPTETLPP